MKKFSIFIAISIVSLIGLAHEFWLQPNKFFYSIREIAKIRLVVGEDFKGEKSSNNEVFVKFVAKNNIRNTISQIRSKSEILKKMESKGEIKIVGVFYTLRTGKLEFVD